MTLRSSDLQSDSDLDSIRNSCDVLYIESPDFALAKEEDKQKDKDKVKHDHKEKDKYMGNTKEKE